MQPGEADVARLQQELTSDLQTAHVLPDLTITQSQQLLGMACDQCAGEACAVCHPVAPKHITMPFTLLTKQDQGD